jgi:hypothetical protein
MFSLVTGLPSTTSATGFPRLCSAASLVICPCSTPRRRACPACACGFPDRSRGPVHPGMPARSLGSRACSFSTCGWLLDYAGPGENSRSRFPQCGLPVGSIRSAPDGIPYRSSIPRPSMPLSTLHPIPHGIRRKTRGQDGSLLLSCGALSSPTARRFIPTFALPCGRGSVSGCKTSVVSEPRPRGSGCDELPLTALRYHFQDLRAEALGLSLSYSWNFEQVRNRSGSAAA